MENPKFLGAKILEGVKLTGLSVVTGLAAAIDEDSKLEMVDGMQVVAQSLGYVPRMLKWRIWLLPPRDRQNAYKQIAWGVESFKRMQQQECV